MQSNHTRIQNEYFNTTSPPNEPHPFDYIWKAIHAHSYNKALDFLDTVDEEERNLVWYEIKAIALFSLRKHNTLITALKDQTQLNDKTLHYLARSYQKTGSYELAMETFFSIKNKDVNTFLAIAYCYEDAGHYDFAIHQFKSILDRSSIILNSKTANNVQAGIKRCKAKQFAQTKLIDKDQSNHLSPFEPVWEAIHWYAYEYALEILDHVEKRDIMWYEIKAIALFSLERYGELITALRDQTQLNNDKILYYLARSYQKTGNYQLAIKTFFSIQCKGEDELIGIAYCYEDMGNYEHAINAFRAVLTLYSSYSSIPDSKTVWDAQAGIDRCEVKQSDQTKLIDGQIHTQLAFQINFFNENDITDLQVNTLFKKKKYNDVIYTVIQNNLFDSENQYYLGYSYLATKNYNAAIYTLSSISKQNKKISMALARCYQQIKRYDDAVMTVQSIPHWEDQADILSFIDDCNQLKNNDEINSKLAIPESQEYPSYLQGLIDQAIQHEQNHNYDAAMAIYHSIAKENNLYVSLMEAHCYQKMKKYVYAVNIYKSILMQWEDNKSALLGLAFCYRQMDRHQLACDIYLNILKYEPNDLETKINLGYCYQEMMLHSDALKNYRSIPNYQNTNLVLLSIGRCQKEMGDYNAAFITWDTILNEKDPQILISLARCYMEIMKHEKALKLLRSIKNNPQALLMMAHCHEEMNDHEKALALYKQLTTHYPDFFDAHYAYCVYLFNKKSSEADAMLDICIKKWPRQGELYLLKCSYKENRDPELLTKDFETIITIFPYHPSAYLKLIVHLIKTDQPDQAKKWISLCESQFPGNQKLFTRLEKIKHTKRLSYFFDDDDDEVDVKTKPLILPEAIQQLLQSMENKNTECYFTGNTLTYLICKQLFSKDTHVDTPNDEQRNIDIIIILKNNAPFVASGFKQNQHHPQLYTAFENKMHINCYVVSILNSSISLHNTNPTRRDFTILGLFCDKEGNIIDPYHGMKDLRIKSLRTIEPASDYFNEDPVKLLRAVNYIIRDYKPTYEVDQAIKNYQPETLSQIDRNKIKSVAKKHVLVLKDAEKQERYLEILIQYSLFTKLFTTRLGENKKITLASWKNELGIVDYQNNPIPLFNQRTQTIQHSSFSPQSENNRPPNEGNSNKDNNPSLQQTNKNSSAQQSAQPRKRW